MAMIEVDNLTKRYGSTTAVSGISFAVERGQIVGFLGRNGAGKTTTMRILTGALGATDGRVAVAGVDVVEQPREAKRHIGYLPEVPPLYTDMTVRAYLHYCARLKRVADPKEAVERAIADTDIGDVAHRIIDHLSKGYRQRVGIAQALVHRPQVLVLDEPVSGLDPAQRRQVLDLLAKLAGEDTTILLSTHVLAEIEPVCDRVVIIHQGRILAQDSLENLSASGGRVALRVARPDPALLQRLRSIEGVAEVAEGEAGRLVVAAGRDVREEVARAAVDHGLLEMRYEQALQDIFLQLTAEA